MGTCRPGLYLLVRKRRGEVTEMTTRTRALRGGRAFTAALLTILLSASFSQHQTFAQILPSPGTLVVTITSPTPGSTVSRTINVSASVSVVGLLVAGVQFKLDGANLGTEDTTAPYAVPWDTTRSGNGTHTLTAVARDALGLRFTSDPVTVTVSNAPPPDTTAPTVSITSPASGSTVSASITVSTSASDNVGVAGVQFTLDGANLDAEDAAAPYSVPWDTRTASNGSHTLTAVARDAAGNRTTSAPVTVTVSNAPPPDPGVTRFEETDSSVTFTAGWTQGNASRPWSGGTAAISAAAGAKATFSFTGTKVAWIGFRGPQTGIGRVFLDGAFAAEVDTYSATEEAKTALFTATGLANASHTLTIEVTGLKNSASTDTTIVVDAFDAEGASPGDPGGTPGVTRFEENDPSVTYTGTWFDSVRSDHSGGLAKKAYTTGPRAAFSFTGTGVRWIGYRTTVAGMARVFLDGTLAAEVDAYSPTPEPQAVMFEARGLSPGQHALVIEVLGTYNPSATAAWIAVDAFDVFQ
jgi:Big-like domain-containing protein